MTKTTSIPKTKSAIGAAFAKAKSEGRMAFMPFITAGDPDMDTTCALIATLAERGADLIEVGFPYSDPIADGPVIQASYTRALGRGLRVKQIFESIGKMKAQGKTLPPLVAMVAYAIVFRLGPERFASDCANAGFSGMIIPDLPGDEAAGMSATASAAGLDLVQLVSPTTPPARVERILASAHGFLYCISVTGTTGVRERLPRELETQLRALRDKTSLQLAVGFGVSRPEHVRSLAGLADGVIVGSAIVRLTEPLAGGSSSRDDCMKAVGALVDELVAATRS